MDYQNKLKDELIIELQKLELELESVKESFKNDRKLIESDLHKRLKELNCHNRITEIMSNAKYSVDEVCRQIVQILPESWQFPEIAEASVEFPDKVFKTPGYRKSKYSLTQEIKVNQKTVGQVEVCYLFDQAPLSDQPFLPEESNLLFSIAVKLGNYIEKEGRKIDLFQSERKYQNLIDNINDVLYEIDSVGVIRYISPSIEKILGYKDEEVIGQSFLNFVGENEAYLSQRFDLLRKDLDIQNEYKVLTKTGESCWIRLSTKAMLENGFFKGGSGTLIDITEKKLIELELQKSEALYRSILNATPDTIIITDLEGKILFTSPTALKMYGYEHSDSFLNRSILDFIAKEDHDKAHDAITEMFKGNFSGVNGYNGIRSDGTTFETDVNGEFIRDADGNPTRMIFVSRDISDRRLTEEKLLQSETRYKSFFEDNNSTMMLIDPDTGDIKDANLAACRYYGWTQAEICRMNISEINTLSKEEVIVQMQNSKQERSKHFFFKHRLANGKIRDVEIYSGPMRFGGSTLLYALGHDITDRIKAEENIRKLSSAVEQSPVSIVITNLDGNIEYANPKTCETTGYNLEELLGKTPRVFKSGETKIDDYNRLWNTITKGNKWQGILHNKKKNGELYWESSTIAPIIDAHGNITHFLAIKEDISEKKKTEEKIKYQNERLSAIINAIPDLLFVSDAEGTYLEYFKSNSDRLLYPENQLIGVNIRDVFDQETAKLYIRKINECIQQKKLVTFEYSADRDDSTRYFEARLAPLGNDRVLRFVRDFTEKVLKDNELKKLSLAVEQSPVSIVITDLDTHIEYVNPAFEATTGYSLAEIIGQKTNILKSGKIDEAIYKDLWETISSGKEWHCEWVNKKKSGELFWENISISPIHLDSGKITNYLAVKQDITLRKHAEQEIRELNANLELKIQQRTAQLAETNKYLLKEIEVRTLAEEALQVKTDELENFFLITLDLLCIADTSGNFIKVNKAWENILGYSTSELESRQFLEFVHPDDLQATLSSMSELSEQHSIFGFTNRYKTKDGSYRYIEWHSSPSGNLIYAAARDITERRNAEEELRKAQMDADQANLAKSEFLSRMSHELRTPMNSILGFAQLLEMGELNAVQKKGVSHIMRSGKHLLDLINEVLDISRIEAGRLSLSMEPLQLSGVIEEMMDIVKPLADERQLTLKLANLSSNQFFVKSDRQRLKQIILNLLNNAIKYNKVNGKVEIKTEMIPQDTNGNIPVRISISDTGLGISAEDLPKLFNPFERIGAEKSGIEGTGLGLAVVKKLVDAMGGKLGVKSIPGEGSTFWFELPRCESQVERVAKSGLLAELASGLVNKTGTILYIEDNNSNIELVEQILSSQRSGIQLISNTYGRQAVNLAINHHPDLILLDLNLPDIHGSEVITLLQAEEKTNAIPVVIISADAMPQQLERFLKEGAKYYLTKPLDLNELLKIIDEFIGG